MAKDDEKQPIIVKRVRGGVEAGHHGGGWKVAYADFMTAMMAFFLLLWIRGASDENKLSGIARYFTPTLTQTENPGAGDQVMMKSSGVMPSHLGMMEQASTGAPLLDVDSRLAVFDSRIDMEPPAVVEYADAPPPAAEEADSALEELRAEVAKAIASDPGLADLRDNVSVRLTDEGLEIGLLDDRERTLFSRGSAVLGEAAQRLIAGVASTVATLENSISITGHTDAAPYADMDGYTNWELSSDRANAARRLLLASGVPSHRLARVSGVADTRPANPADPFADENRRITVTLQPIPVRP